MRRIELIESIRKEFVDNKIKHVQILYGVTSKRQPVIKFTSVDTPGLNAKVKEICDRYCESMYLIKETKSTLVYGI